MKFKFTAKSNVNPFVGFVESELNDRLESARDYLEKRIRSKFSRDGATSPSNPGTYPKRLSGLLRDNIVVKMRRVASTGQASGLHVSFSDKRAERKLMALEAGFTLPKKGNGSKPRYYALPVSFLAKNMSSRGHGPRKFPYSLVPRRLKWNGRPVLGLVHLYGETRKKITGQGGALHYLLLSGPIVVKPRKGIGHALQAEMANLDNFFSR